MKISFKNNPLNFFKHWKKHGFKKTCKDLKYNYIMLDTPEQILKKQIIGYAGSMFGALFAGVTFWFNGSRVLIILFAFSSYLMYINMKQAWRQLQSLKNVKNLFEGQEILGLNDK